MRTPDLPGRRGAPGLARAGRVARLQLGPDAHARLGREGRQLDQRRVADRLHDVPIAPSAGPVAEPLSRHYFTEYSEVHGRWCIGLFLGVWGALQRPSGDTEPNIGPLALTTGEGTIIASAFGGVVLVVLAVFEIGRASCRGR